MAYRKEVQREGQILRCSKTTSQPTQRDDGKDEQRWPGGMVDETLFQVLTMLFANEAGEMYQLFFHFVPHRRCCGANHDGGESAENEEVEKKSDLAQREAGE